LFRTSLTKGGAEAIERGRGGVLVAAAVASRLVKGSCMTTNPWDVTAKKEAVKHDDMSL